MHDSLFSHQADLGGMPWSGLAASAGVPDSNAFKRCIEDSQTGLQVKADIDLARDLGLTGTPTVFINKRRLPGTPTPEFLIEAVRGELAQRRGK
jgi:protein-disulfide isomerase